MRISALLFAAPLFLLACSSAPPPVDVVVAPQVKEEPTPIIIEQKFTSVLGSNFRGQFKLRDGKGYFKACDANKELSVNTNFALSSIYEKISSASNKPVYIEFTGEITFPKNKSKKPDANMRIDKVHHMALAKASLQCKKPIDNFVFKANGDDPYWRLSIDDQELYFSTKASNQAYHVDDANFRTEEINTINTTNNKGQQLKLKIKPGHCYDLTGKTYWGYTTKVHSIWGEYSGCGEPGWPAEEQLLTGYYLNTNNKVTTNIAFNPDYTVEYKETVDNKETIKTGFWKKNSPNRVVVMLTQQSGKTLRQELTFKRQGLTLKVEEINNNNIMKSLSQALTFNKMNAKAGVEKEKVNRINREFSAQRISPTKKIDVGIQKAVNDYFKIHRTDPKDTKFSAVKYDLNGDGIDDAIVLLDWCSNNNECDMLILEGKKEGYRFSSRISRVQPPIIVSLSQHYLWQSLLIEKSEGWSSLNFDGISYPINTRNLKVINKADYSTGVILFNKGKPTQWFPVKM